MLQKTEYSKQSTRFSLAIAFYTNPVTFATTHITAAIIIIIPIILSTEFNKIQTTAAMRQNKINPPIMATILLLLLKYKNICFIYNYNTFLCFFLRFTKQIVNIINNIADNICEILIFPIIKLSHLNPSIKNLISE